MPPKFDKNEESLTETVAGQVFLELDKPKLRVALSLNRTRRTDQHFTDEMVMEALSRFRVTEGIDADAIANAVAAANSGKKNGAQRVIIAKGRQPLPSEDARFEFPVLERLELRDTDLENLIALCQRRIINVREGEDVAIYHPVEDGQPGVTVRGTPIPFDPGVDPTPKPGAGLRWDDKTLVSEVDGRFVLEEKILSIEQVLRYDESLTAAHGDIEFVGEIVINGNIEAGVTVRCDKDLDVQGSVIGSSLRVGGNLAVSNGIIGASDVTFEVAGNAQMGFAENADLRVEGQCEIRDSMATSTLRCSRDLNMLAGRGHIVSGIASAREGIKVRTVGIDVNTRVRLAVGRDALAEEQRLAFDDEIDQLKKKLNEIREVEQRLGPLTKSYSRLLPSKRSEIDLLLDQIPRLDTQLQEAREKSTALQTRMIPIHESQISVMGDINVDTIVEFPLMRFKVTKKTRGVLYLFDSSKSRIESKAA